MNTLSDSPSSARPTEFSATVALVAALGGCFVGTTGAVQLAPLLLEAIGIALFAGGVVRRRRSRRLSGRVLTACGLLTIGFALVSTAALAAPLPTVLPVLGCAVGLLLLTVGLFPVFGRWTRSLALAGLSVIFGSLIANAIVGDPTIWRPATAVAMLFLSWDVAERGTTLGAQVGNDGNSATEQVELIYTTTSGIVAGVAVVLTVGAARLTVTGASPAGLALVLLATVAFLLSLVHVPSRLLKQ